MDIKFTPIHTILSFYCDPITLDIAYSSQSNLYTAYVFVIIT